MKHKRKSVSKNDIILSIIILVYNNKKILRRGRSTSYSLLLPHIITTPYYNF
ncbi:hypothetical protein NBO_256g0001 [Nosema bombycis CQ1]|uniref:Uncharacterized protein n=1 Tax=Nosema bombycis (strain CQ1 / CVCC 102059) TaxID=578461 RepID=R0MFV4_NOSB1|nr:hypothetical protein NBO_256g0001 [Nosema bombycis CQ1]|eukprot:EOB13015.1 hypothetical protein NBO_256g0001 [Nosema bombycis CQ1]